MLTIHELHEKLVNGDVSAVELTKAFLAHKDTVEPKVQAFLSDNREYALEAAAAVDAKIAAGETISDLAGVPGAIKDNICIKGQKATCASKMLENFKSPYNATVIDKLMAADYVSLGKTNMDEFAMGSSTENSAFQLTHNPWNLDCVPGGSSGGSSGDSGYTPPSSSGGYVWPCPGFYYLSSEWNEDRYTYNHGAIDIAGGGIMGATVVAADSGTVISSNSSCVHNWGKSGSCGCGGGYGNYVWIDHGNGKATVYAHLSSVSVSTGQYVSQGQVLGYVGSTGESTGPHLHFECRYYGEKYNPMTEF